MAKTELAKLSTRFQITIPKTLRNERDLQPGQVFAFISTVDGMLLVPVPRREGLTGLVDGTLPGKYRDRFDRT